MAHLKTFGTVEPEVLQQMETALTLSHAEHGVLCADNHIGYSVPVGGVLAIQDAICVNGVGFDIACGNKAVLTDANPATTRQEIARLMDTVQKEISFGIGRKNNEPVDHPLFDEPIWQEIPLLQTLKAKAHAQLGTVGSGNHYVDIFTDELERVWIGVHFGSRGLGHTICTHFIQAAGGKDGIHAKPVVLHENSDLGAQYLKCMELAGKYAYAGRDWVCARVAKILHANILEEVHNHHNFAWKESHFDKSFWVIRKGATPCFPTQKSFVGGSMGDLSFILEGTPATQESREALFSTIHGAGRVLGRTQAKGKRDRKGRLIKPPLVSHSEMLAWINAQHVELRGADVDEAPQCYKRITAVLKAHGHTVKVLHTLKPLGVCMATDREKDPYKD